MRLRRNDKYEQRAVDILTEHDFDDIPVDVYGLAQALGLDVQLKDMDDDISAFLLIEGEKQVIVVNKRHGENRRRFSIAHEIGHFCLHHTRGEDRLFIDKATYYRNNQSHSGLSFHEIEANRFAASLLMPSHHITNYINPSELIFDNEIDNVGNLANNEFKVSEQAMTLRLVRLRLMQP